MILFFLWLTSVAFSVISSVTDHRRLWKEILHSRLSLRLPFFFFLLHHDPICDQLLNRPTATWNLNNNGADLITIHVEKTYRHNDMIEFKRLRAKNCSPRTAFSIWLGPIFGWSDVSQIPYILASFSSAIPYHIFIYQGIHLFCSQGKGSGVWGKVARACQKAFPVFCDPDGEEFKKYELETARFMSAIL